MLFSPEVAIIINIVFLCCFTFSLGYFMFGLILPLSNVPTVIPPGPAFPAMCTLALIYYGAYGTLFHFVPLPEHYAGDKANVALWSALSLLLLAAGAGLGKWKPMA